MSRLDVLRGFFSSMPGNILGLLENFDEEEIECLYWSLTDSERFWFDAPDTGEDYDNMVKLLVYTKVIWRGQDAQQGRCVWDDNIEKLYITKECSMLELPIAMNTYLELLPKRVYSIQDVMNVVEDPNCDLKPETIADLGNAFANMQTARNVVLVEDLHAV